MARQPSVSRISFLLLPIAILILVFSTASQGATHPDRPVRGGKSQPMSTTPGETPFVCGTYKGNQAENPQRQALHLYNQKTIQQGLKATTATGLDYIYDNVWVIEDDGSLTLSGTNAFDTDASTFQFANNGGGVYTVTKPAFSYDATLGSVVATGDDGEVLVALPFSFPFAGGSYTQMHVSGNGAVSFGAVMNPNGFYDSADFYSDTPKIAAYYLDLDETAAGDVRVRSEATKYTVTWIGVREYGSANPNTFQLVLYPSGNFTLTYSGIASITAQNGSPVILGNYPGGFPTIDEISFSSGLPHVSPASAAIFEQYFSYFTPLVDEVALFNRFYSQFPDDFFQIIYFTSFPEDMGSAFAYERNIQNDVTGIGLPIFDASDQYGSGGKLESLCNMGFLNQWSSSDPAARVYGKGNSFLTIMGQESGHRWGAFVFFDKGSGPSNLILGRSDAHWSYYFDVDHSSIEGGDWIPSGPNFTCPTNIDFFSELDEYLFGLRTANEVKDMFYISSASNNQPAARSVGTPVINATASGTVVGVTVEDIILAEGARTPLEPDEEHDVRQAFIFLVAQGTAPTQQQLDKIAGFRRAWETYFEKSCDGRLSCNTSLGGPYDVGVLCGEVRDRYSQHLIPEFTARSVERSFVQHVPADGRFIFRYDDGPLLGSSEPVTLIFSAPGYYPDTLATTVTYGTTTKFSGLYSGIWLTPVPSAAGEAPSLTELHGNHPNPFNPATTIEYSLGEAGRVRLDVFDAAGRHVRSLVDRAEAKGAHRIAFDGRDDGGQPLASGVYLYRLEAGQVTKTRKMVLLK